MQLFAFVEETRSLPVSFLCLAALALTDVVAATAVSVATDGIGAVSLDDRGALGDQQAHASARRSLVRRSEAVAPSSLLEDKAHSSNRASSGSRSKGPEFGQCEWHGFACVTGTKDCQACTLTGLVENSSGAVVNEFIESGDFCVGSCKTGNACPTRMICQKGELFPVEKFQCIDMTSRCCLPFIANAPWPPCVQENEGIVEGGGICTPRCKNGFTASEKVLVCAGGAAQPFLSPQAFECIPDDFEADSS
eukprot:TRINITY_DN41255_c0_g1_i2.p1 TRINITY_DN41255_c0_g1~~TRINITY_DN41255_c0_g1_i2.p1  ORF type:complete len:250 (-),score=59.30 TRINITY_DN41255_c0_g1_i2:46-795(-)